MWYKPRSGVLEPPSPPDRPLILSSKVPSMFLDGPLPRLYTQGVCQSALAFFFSFQYDNEHGINYKGYCVDQPEIFGQQNP